jgi:hypothetical protein
VDRADGYWLNDDHELCHRLQTDLDFHVDAGRIADVNGNDGERHWIDEWHGVQF